jgi:NAD(P)-dependent dehydrogenase (short-subunit alcohol dehydrogenase family)
VVPYLTCLIPEECYTTQTQHVTCDSMLHELHSWEYIRECEFDYWPPLSQRSMGLALSPIMMRTGLLLLAARSCSTSSRRCEQCTSVIHRWHHPSSSFAHDHGQRRSIARQLPATASSSPDPPMSHGTPVFPDIDFQVGSPGVGGGESAATRRNADADAVFVVSGSSRGIGLQFVASLLERTRGTVLACCRSPPAAHRLIELASLHPHRVSVLPLDVEDQDSIDALARTIASVHGRVDLLFNVAGVLGDGGATTPGPERSLALIERGWMEKSLSVNVVGPTMLARALSPLMRTAGRRSVEMSVVSSDGDAGGIVERVARVELPPGRPPTVVVNLSARVGSISDNRSGGWYSYRASKAALNMATRTMGHELRRQGTFVVALHPGTTDTGLSKPFRRSVGEGRLFPVEFTVRTIRSPPLSFVFITLRVFW